MPGPVFKRLPAKPRPAPLRAGAISLWLLAALVGGATSDRPSIDHLVEQLGSESYPTRQAAEESLIRLQSAAIEALRVAEQEGQPEVRHRARRALRTITHPSDTQRSAQRSEAQAAFMAGKFERMQVAYSHLAALEGASYHDMLQVGHAEQLLQRWDRAVKSYERALAALDQVHREAYRRQVAAQQELLDKFREAQAGKKGDKAAGKRAQLMARQLERQQAYHVHLRALLRLLIGRIRRDCLNDAKAALAAFENGLQGFPAWVVPFEALLPGPVDDGLRTSAGNGRFEGGPLRLIRAIARTQAAQHGFITALPTWRRYAAAAYWHRGAFALPPEVIAQIKAIVPTPTPAAPPPLAIVLDREAPTHYLDLTDPATLFYCHAVTPTEDEQRWGFLVLSPPGTVIGSMRVTATVDDTEFASLATIRCRTTDRGTVTRQVEQGALTWPEEAETPMRTQHRDFAFDDPPASLTLEVVQAPGRAQVQNLSIAAVLRGAPVRPPPPARSEVTIETDPVGGQITHNGKVVGAGWHRDLAPGPCRFAFTPPGELQPVQVILEAAPNRHHALFINRESPFKSTPTNLPRMPGTMTSHAALAPLLDGGTLLAFTDADGQVLMLTTSVDRRHWQPPQPSPFSRHCRTRAPALHVDSLGVVWMAFLSNRLDSDPDRAAGYRLWLTHTRDGRQWARPRPMTKNTASGGGVEPAQFLSGPDGSVWLYWRDFVSHATTPSELQPLVSMQMQRTHKVRVRHPSISVDTHGTFHMVFLERNRHLRYCQSTDGKTWTAPQPADGVEDGDMVGAPQLFVRDGRAALLFETSEGGWLRRGHLDQPLRLSDPVRITGIAGPPCAARGHRNAFGQIVLLSGGDTPALLHAEAEAFFGPHDAPP